MELNLGCGTLNREPNQIGIDIALSCKPDICADIERLPIKSSVVDVIYCSHTLEHVQNIVAVMNEAYRVLKNGGIMIIVVPLFPKLESVIDPTHKTFFVPESFEYFCEKGKISGYQSIFNSKGVFIKDNSIIAYLEKPLN